MLHMEPQEATAQEVSIRSVRWPQDMDDLVRACAETAHRQISRQYVARVAEALEARSPYWREADEEGDRE